MASSKRKKELHELSDVELTQKAKGLRNVLAVIGGVFVLYVGYFVYLLASGSCESGKQTALIVGLVAMVGGSMPSWAGLKQIREEQAKRAAN